MIEAAGEPECLLVACSANWQNSDLRSKTAPRSRGAKRVDEACCNGQRLAGKRESLCQIAYPR